MRKPAQVLASLAAGAVLTAQVLAETKTDQPVVLVRDGQPECTIVVSNKPSRMAVLAAAELQWHVKQITGTEIPVVRETEEIKGLPIYIGEKTPSTPVPLEGNVPGGEERILLVDDEEAILDVGVRALERFGYRVTPCTDGPEALSLYTMNPESYDLVLTDLTMPKMTGIELAQRLLEIRPDLPIVLCTGFSEAAQSEQAKTLGIREIVNKPLLYRDLAFLIHGILKDRYPRQSDSALHPKE